MPVEATSSKRTRSIAHVEILAVLFAVGIKSTSGLVSLLTPLPGSGLGTRLSHLQMHSTQERKEGLVNIAQNVNTTAVFFIS